MGGRHPRPLVALVAAALTALPATASAAAEPEPFVAGLDLPVSMAFAPDGRLFVAEQHLGDIRVVEDGALVREPFAHIDVLGTFEQGLLGIALHPDFPDEPWLYAYYSDPLLRINRLARLPVDRAGEPEILLDLLTTERGYHNGGDLVFGSDGMLYITVGEVHEPERAQDPADLGGKVLRLAPDGSVPDDNPFGPGIAAYSIGHRNSFGICLDPETGDLWETENGPTSDDEVNLLRAGGNYGWPEQLGPGGAERGFADPVLDYPTQIVPTGCAVWDGDLYFGSYGDGSVRRLRLPVEEPTRDQAWPSSANRSSISPSDPMPPSTSPPRAASRGSPSRTRRRSRPTRRRLHRRAASGRRRLEPRPGSRSRPRSRSRWVSPFDCGPAAGACASSSRVSGTRPATSRPPASRSGPPTRAPSHPRRTC
jgi:quinoprotein glucose dehydrogenase